MSNFWDVEDEPIKTDGNFASGGGEILPIPANTSVLAAVDEAKWTEYKGDRMISLRWNVLQPSEYKNRKIFQKVKVLDKDSKVSDKAKRMLAAIDTNAKGGLIDARVEPTDISLTRALVGKPMVINLQIWKTDPDEQAEVKKGNWVSKVAPKGSAISEPKPTVQQSDEIPFD